jgi:hypothetical protein
MNLNIYINDNLATQLDVIAACSHKKRNTLIQEAISLLVQNYKKDKWPDSILHFQGINNLTGWEGFEQHRKELKEPEPDIDIFKDL